MNRVTAGLFAVAVVAPLCLEPLAGAAALPPTPSPATVLAINPLDIPATTRQQLQGSLCEAPNTCRDINFLPVWVPQGANALNDAITSTPGPVIVFGYSQGAQVAEQWLKHYGLQDGAPDSSKVTFVVIANATRAYGGSLVVPAGGVGAPHTEVWPDSKYTVIDVAREYDMTADFPNNPSSPSYLLAVANAFAGFLTIHFDYRDVNINDPANTVWTVGNTTYVLTPTENLPLLSPLRTIGLGAVADRLNGPLKAQIDTAYDRNYPGLQPAGTPGLAVKAAASPATDPAPALDTTPSPRTPQTSAATAPRTSHRATTTTRGPRKSGDTGTGVAAALNRIGHRIGQLASRSGHPTRVRHDSAAGARREVE